VKLEGLLEPTNANRINLLTHKPKNRLNMLEHLPPTNRTIIDVTPYVAKAHWTFITQLWCFGSRTHIRRQIQMAL